MKIDTCNLWICRFQGINKEPVKLVMFLKGRHVNTISCEKFEKSGLKWHIFDSWGQQFA